MINLYLVDTFNPLTNNGLGAYLNELNLGLSSYASIRVHRVFLNSSKFRVYTYEHVEGVSYLHIPFINPSQFDREVAGLLVSDMKLKGNIIVHLNWINHCSLAWHLKEKINCKIVLTKHCVPWRDLVTNNYEEFYDLNYLYKNKKKLPIANSTLKREQIDYAYIDHIITVTNDARESLKFFFGIPEDKLSVIYNGLHNKLTDTGSSKGKLRVKYGFEKEDIILLFAGNVNKRKGIFDLVNAFEKFVDKQPTKKMRLIISGPGNHSVLLASIKKHWAKITITGSVDRDTLFDLYRIADIGIIPSYIEQCSYSVIEMMQNGLPIIASEVDGLKEILPEYPYSRVKVIYHPYKGAVISSKELLDRFRFIIDNPKIVRDNAKKIKQEALDKFSANQMVSKTVELYNRLVSKPNHIKPPILSNGIVEHGCPLVSVVVIMNGDYTPERLNLCLNDIYNQTYNNLEIIIVNGGSSFKLKPVRKHDRKVRLINIDAEPNSEMPFFLDKALEFSKGKYITVLSINNRVMKDRIKLQIDFLEKKPKVGLVGSWHEIIDKYGKIINRTELFTNHREIEVGMLFFNQLNFTSITIRRDIACQHFEGTSYNSEYAFFLGLLKKTEFSNLPQFLTSIQLNDSNGNKIKNIGLQKETINLLSAELDALGISHSVDELVLHSAIGFGYGSRYVNTLERLEQLHKWLNKVFESKALTKKRGVNELLSLKSYIIQHCNINRSLLKKNIL